MLNVFVDYDRIECGQTSRPVVGTQIQTSCDFEANLHVFNYVLCNFYRLFHDVREK